jgi:hypothetical protein
MYRKNPTTSARFEPANLGTRGQHAIHQTTEAAYADVTSDTKTTVKSNVLRSIVTMWGKERVAFVILHLTCMWRVRGLLGRLAAIVKLQFSHKRVSCSCMLNDVHHRVLKRIVMGLHGSRMYCRKQISGALEKL